MSALPRPRVLQLSAALRTLLSRVAAPLMAAFLQA